MKKFGVCAPSWTEGSKATFAALGEAFRVQFEARQFGDDAGLDGWVVLNGNRQVLENAAGILLPAYVSLADSEVVECGDSSLITFANQPELDPALRNRIVSANDAAIGKRLPAWASPSVAVAFKEHSPVWVIRRTAGGPLYVVSIPPPELSVDEPLFAHLCRQRLVALLPLIVFLRSVVEEQGWQQPPVQAAFMFDDPNLRHPSYGYIDYAEMAARALAARYHVAIATIPLDSCFVSASAARVFRQNPGSLSLLYHGNDHLANELARGQSAQAMSRLLGQAKCRMARMEAASGLDVASVMAPPNGACSGTAIREMGRLQFEGVCVSRGSLQYHNPGATWVRTLGINPCDHAEGLSLIHRFQLSETCENDILLAALFRQPIVPMTHHGVLADGYDLLERTASRISSYGPVEWRGMRSISRSLYSHRLEADTLRLRMWSKRITVDVPDGVVRLEIQRPWPGSSSETVFVRSRETRGQWVAKRSSEQIFVEPGITEIASWERVRSSVCQDTDSKRSLVPVMRRLLTELRDRALPSVHAAGFGSGRPNG